jgi:hypothetical protein
LLRIEINLFFEEFFYALVHMHRRTGERWAIL